MTWRKAISWRWNEAGSARITFWAARMWRLAQMLADIAALAGRKRAQNQVCRAAPLFPLAFAAEAVARITGKEPFLTADALRMSRYRMYFSSAKARRELGYTARPYREGLKDAHAWFARHGYL